jgi:PAS domain S-box-containing protein
VRQGTPQPLGDDAVKSIAGHAAEGVNDSHEIVETLRRERERLAIALRAGQLGAYEWRIGADEIWWSPETYIVYGVTPSTFSPTVDAFVALVHPDDRDELWAKTMRAIEQRELFAHEYRIQPPDGVTRWVANRSQVGLDATGRVERITGIALDITERKRAEQRLEVLVSSIDDHLVAYDRQWRYTFVNEAAARVLGMSRKDLLGQCIWELFPSAIGNQYYRSLHSARDEQRVIHEEHYYEPFQRWFENHIYPTPDGVTVFSTDITARKQVEVALRHSQDALRETDRRKDEFLAMLAHELRNPLAAIANAVQILRRAQSEPNAARLAHGILDRQMRHMVRQVDDLLDVSRISRGRLELRKSRIDLAEVIREAVEATRQSPECADRTLTFGLPGEPVPFDGDPVRLSQVIGNLLNNGCKFTDPGGTIHLTLSRDEGDAVIRIRDDGVGIPEEHLQRIFEMFTQVDTSLERSRHGLGLGLTLVQRIVQMHGGTVEARSEGRRGSEFIVRLPLA